jgi:hypothetical protein
LQGNQYLSDISCRKPVITPGRGRIPAMGHPMFGMWLSMGYRR